MSDIPRIFADFNDLLSRRDRVWLGTVGARRDLDRAGVELEEGMRVIVYDHDLDDADERDDILADGVATRDAASGRWMVIIDRDTIRHDSDDRPAE